LLQLEERRAWGERLNEMVVVVVVVVVVVMMIMMKRV
jgi:hypothetical protein